MRGVYLSIVPLLLLCEPLTAQTSSTVPSHNDVQTISPALLAKAQPIAAIILPSGTMEKMMGPTMQKMMGPMADSMLKMPVRDLLKAGGMDPATADNVKSATIEEVMAILDPNFKKRMDVIINRMMPELGRFMARFEPDMRAGMAEAFAYRYNVTELEEISAFLKTPAGAKFGSGFMELATDPHYLDRIQKIMPEMMQAMPEIMKSSVSAIEALPKPRAYKDLSKAERSHLAELLGIDPKKFAK